MGKLVAFFGGLFLQHIGDVAEVDFFDGATFVANDKLRTFMFVVFAAGHIGVEAFYAVDEAVGA